LAISSATVPTAPATTPINVSRNIRLPLFIMKCLYITAHMYVSLRQASIYIIGGYDLDRHYVSYFSIPISVCTVAEEDVSSTFYLTGALLLVSRIRQTRV